MVKERLFKQEYASELIKIAANDLDAARVLARSPNVRQEDGADMLVDLSDFASIKRYEEGTFVPSPEELKATINLADKVVSTCRTLINGKNRDDA